MFCAWKSSYFIFSNITIAEKHLKNNDLKFWAGQEKKFGEIIIIIIIHHNIPWFN